MYPFVAELGLYFRLALRGGNGGADVSRCIHSLIALRVATVSLTTTPLFCADSRRLLFTPFDVTVLLELEL